MAGDANSAGIGSSNEGMFLETIVERLERIHLQLHLEIGQLSPSSEMARRLLDLSEETEAVLQRVRSYGNGH